MMAWIRFGLERLSHELSATEIAPECLLPLSAVKLLEEGHAGDDAEIAEWMSGNICRCAAYPNIRAAIRDVRDATGGER